MSTPKSILLLVLLCTSLFSNAQKNLVEGYIVTNTGDTLFGKIDNLKWGRTPQKITFVSASLGKVVYKPEEILAFKITNENTYIRSRTSLDITPHELTRLLRTNERVVVPDTMLLLKQLVKGRINLFTTRDSNDKIHFFIQKQQEPLTELIDHYFINIKDRKFYEVHRDIYNQQLFELCQDCSMFDSKLFEYTYSEKALTDVILSYNRFFGDNAPVTVSVQEKYRKLFYAKVGISSYHYYTSALTVNYSKQVYEKSGLMGYSLGVGSYFELPSFRRKLGVFLDGGVYMNEEDIKLYSDAYIPPKNNLYLAFALGPQFSILKNAKKAQEIFVDAGIVCDVPLTRKGTHNLYQKTTLMYGYKLGLGVRYRKIQIDVSYIRNNAGLRNADMLEGNINRMMFSLGYAFGK